MSFNNWNTTSLHSRKYLDEEDSGFLDDSEFYDDGKTTSQYGFSEQVETSHNSFNIEQAPTSQYGFNHNGPQTSQYGFNNTTQPQYNNTNTTFSQQPPNIESNYGFNVFNPGAVVQPTTNNTYDYDNEPPILTELGINIPDIFNRIKAVLLFTRVSDELILQIDFGGPLLILLALGLLLGISGKAHFGYIYGLGLFGTSGIWLLIKLMNPKNQESLNFSFYSIIAIMGYGLLPVCLLSILGVFMNLGRLNWYIIVCLFTFIISWCTAASSRFIAASGDMRKQRFLIAYPIAMVYSVFVTLVIF